MKDIETESRVLRARIKQLELHNANLLSLQAQHQARIAQYENLIQLSESAGALSEAQRTIVELTEKNAGLEARNRALALDMPQSVAPPPSVPVTAPAALSLSIEVNPPILEERKPGTDPHLSTSPPIQVEIGRVYKLTSGFRVRVMEQQGMRVLIERQSDGKQTWVPADELVGNSTPL